MSYISVNVFHPAWYCVSRISFVLFRYVPYFMTALGHFSCPFGVGPYLVAMIALGYVPQI